MKSDNYDLMLEIRDLLRTVIEGQEKLAKEVQEIREEQKRLHEEVRLSNFVLNNIAIRSEMLN